MIRVFTQHGDRTNRKKARLKYLIDSWGIEKFLCETEKLLAFPLIRVPASECEPRSPIDRAGHIGIHPQSQPGLHYIGLSIPVGRLPVAQMRAIADIADRFGSGEVRLTVWQNLLIPNIHTRHLADAERALAAAGLNYKAGTVLSGTVACTGNQGCRFSATDTKTHAVVLANLIDERFPILDQPINLHVTGCHHSCAQHYIGDLGLMGVKVGGEEGYQVLIGGGADQDQGLARELIPAIRFTGTPGQNGEPLLRLYPASQARRVLPRLHTSPHDRRTSIVLQPAGELLAMQILPFIPDNAPFTTEQRGWLNGFLAGLYSTAPASPVADPLPSLKIAVLYASQSGTAEGLARKVTKDLKAKGHIASLISLEGYTPAALLAERYAIFIASTYGEGDAPDAVRPFYEQLCLEHFPCCGELSYAVLALGDSSYENFCKFGKDLDNKLAALGGVRHR